MKLSKYATLQECIKSVTASRLGVDNTPDFEAREALKAVCINIFDPCREFVGGPLAISSGYRGPKLNKAVGGSKTSEHMVGQALDIDCDTFGNGTNAALFHFIKDNLEFNQLIWEFGTDKNPEWIHVSYSRLHNKKQVLKASKVNGKTVYTKWK